MPIKFKFVCSSLVASASVLGCVGTSISSADEHATNACLITEESDGSYSRPLIPPDELTWNIDNDLTSLEKASKSWIELASEASAASQDDAGFYTLSALTSDISAMRREVVSTRKNAPWAVTLEQILGLQDWNLIYDNYNSQLNKYQTECMGLSTRLND